MAVVFHSLMGLDEALERIEKRLGGITPRKEEVSVFQSLGRVLAENVKARISYPPFDRSSVDGYAVYAPDTYTASENTPVELEVVGKAEVGRIPEPSVEKGRCVEISTGAPIPRGANAVVMVEYTKRKDDKVLIFHPVSPGENISQAGSDISIGDIILRKGTLITPREVASLVSVGHTNVPVYRPPRVAVFSTGNEIMEIGKPLEDGMVYDVNGPTITCMVRELGAEAEFMGILPDNYEVMKRRIIEALEAGFDIVITSGSTSAGFGDMIYRVFSEISGGEVIIHGLKIKPGKPTAVAIAGDKLLIGLPGFPLSAMVVFIMLVKPLLMKMMGKEFDKARSVRARIPFRIEAGRGKLELIPVQIIHTREGEVAYPLLGHSGSASLLALADGIVEVGENRQFIDEGEEVEVRLLSEKIRPADLIIIGSHCPGVDILLEEAGLLNAKVINVGSLAGWYAVKRGEADIAGTHLLDEKTRRYNTHMLDAMNLRGKAVLVRGYARKIGLLVKKGNPKGIRGLEDLLRGDIVLVNRIKGSGIRTFLDIRLREILGNTNPVERIRGYDYEVKTHSAVASAILHDRADVGIAVKAIAHNYGLDFIPLGEEIYDFLILKDKLEKTSIQRFLKTLSSENFAQKLEESLPGYRILDETGKIVEE